MFGIHFLFGLIVQGMRDSGRTDWAAKRLRAMELGGRSGGTADAGSPACLSRTILPFPEPPQGRGDDKNPAARTPDRCSDQNRKIFATLPPSSFGFAIREGRAGNPP